MTTATNPASKISLAKRSEETPAPQPQGHTANKVDGMALILARNTFYQFTYNSILYIVLGQVAMVITLTVALWQMVEYTSPRDYYFPMRANNELIQELPLSESIFTDSQIRDWAQEAVTNTLTFGYYDHLIRLQNARAYFTTPGWADFTQALEEAQVLTKIGALGVEGGARDGKVVVTNIRQGTTPVITAQGVNGYHYEWHVSMTVDLSFYDLKQQYRQSWKVDLRIVRVRSMASRFGIGIQQLVAESSLE